MPLRSLSEGLDTARVEICVDRTGIRADFLMRVFEAAERIRLHMRDDKSAEWHCELRIGDSRVRIGQTVAAAEPLRLLAQLFVPDSEAVFACAARAGARVVMPLDCARFGTRRGSLIDSFGNAWLIAALDEASLSEARSATFEQIASRNAQFSLCQPACTSLAAQDSEQMARKMCAAHRLPLLHTRE
jgi:PhnB protein